MLHDFCVRDCVRPLQHLKAWDSFSEHAARHNEAFLLAGLICTTVLASESVAAAKASFWRFHHELIPWPALVDLASKGQSMRDRWRQRRSGMLQQSFTLLHRVLGEHNEADFLTDDAYGELCGQLDLCDIFVEFEHPLAARLEEAGMIPRFESFMRDLEETGVLRALKEAAVETQQTEELLQAPNCPIDEVFGVQCFAPSRDTAPLFPNVQGLGLFASVALINHACSPSLQLLYREGCHLGLVVALRDIRAGEELSIAYLDLESLPDRSLSDRQEHLQEGYGFLCCCGRCVAEAASLNRGLKRTKEGTVQSDAERQAAKRVLRAVGQL